MHWLKYVRRRATSEVSLLLTVARNLENDQIWKGGKGWGEKEIEVKGGGLGSRCLLDEGGY